MEFYFWLILSSIELIGIIFLFAQLMKKIETNRFRVILGWSMFAGGLGVKLILYGIQLVHDINITYF